MVGFLGFDQNVFDELHPFSFIANSHGELIHAGRTFAKLFGVNPCGFNIKQLGIAHDPLLQAEPIAPKHLVGESIRLELNRGSALSLRGHVVVIDPERERYLFVLEPVITDPKQLGSLGLDVSDFEVGTPILDQLLLLHEKARANELLAESNRQLLQSVVMLNLLRKVTLDAFQIRDSALMYERAVASVASELKWEIGHVFERASTEEADFRSTDIWYLTDRHRYEEFVCATGSLAGCVAPEFLDCVSNEKKAHFFADLRSAKNFSSRGVSLIPGNSAIAAVLVPIIQDDKVRAVVEFISEKPKAYSTAKLEFFTLFGMELGFALAQHEHEQKERDRLECLAHSSKMATLGEMAAGIAHEVNNPISTISLLSSVMKGMVVPGKLRPELLAEQLQRVDLCVGQVSQIVRRLQDFSRNSSKDQFRSTSVDGLVRDSVALCEARFKSKGVSLILPELQIDRHVECRSSQISQVLLNLLSNALDAVEGQKRPMVWIDVCEHGNMLEISVSDSGPGVAPADRPKIMEAFFTTKPPGKGTGLGLSISSSIAHEHGGDLRFDDAAEHTRFVLTLPRQLSS